MASKRSNQRGLGLVAWLGLIAIVAGLLFAAYVWLMLSWSYSRGERAGWVQKLSEKGYVCKTWEGEMAMVTMPGSIPEKFLFTVRDDAIAEKIKAVMGKRVALDYEEHIGLITSCFGDTGHFVKDVKVIDETPAPLIIPGQSLMPSSAPQQQATPKQWRRWKAWYAPASAMEPTRPFQAPPLPITVHVIVRDWLNANSIVLLQPDHNVVVDTGYSSDAL